MIDLHIHTTFSDGEINLINSQLCKFEDYKVLSFTDHEYIFDPDEYKFINTTARFLSGVEICCNIDGIFIEILGYNFNAKHREIQDLVMTVRNRRIDIYKEILDRNGIQVENIPKNPFRKDINIICKDIDRTSFWKMYNLEYKKNCHSEDYRDVINSIQTAGGIAVLAHPMESFKNKSEREVENLIKKMGVNTVEMITLKHSVNDVALIGRIVDKYNLQASIGSDTHAKNILPQIHKCNILERKFQWINEFLC